MAEASSQRPTRRQQADSQATSEAEITQQIEDSQRGGRLRQWPKKNARGQNGKPPGAGDGTEGGTSLRLRLLQTVLPAVLLPLLFMGLSGYWLTHKRSDDDAQRQLQNQALLTSESTTALLDELQTIPQIIASSPLVINEARAGSETVSAEKLDEVADADLEEQYAASRLLRTHYRLNTYLTETAQSSDIAEILVTERHGFNVAYSKLTTDFVQSDEDWWQNGKEYGQWVSPPDFDFASKNITVELVKSIQDPATGDFLGVVKTILPARKFRLLAQYLQRTGISGSQRVQLIDGGELKTIDTFSPQGSRKSRDIIGAQAVENLVKVFGSTDLSATDDRRLLTVLRKDNPVKNLSIPFKDETTTVVSFTHVGRQFKLANVPGTQWVAIASMDYSEIEALGRSQLALLGLTTLVLGGVTTAFLLWLSRQLTNPLDSLADQAHQVAGGDFNTLVTPVGTAETRTLTKSFNQLVVKTKGLLERQETATQKAQVFAAITSATANTLGDLVPILAETLPESQRLLNADRMLFYPVESGQSQLLATASNRPELPSAPPSSAGCVPFKLLTVKPDASAVAINDVRQLTQDDAHQAYLRSLNIGATLTMPVFNDGELFGFLIAQRSTPGPWQNADADFITQLATQFRLVLDRISSFQRVKDSRRIEQESRQVVQESQKMAQESRQMAQESRQMAEVLTVEKQQQQERLQHQISALVYDIQGVSQGDLTVRARVPDGDLKTVADVFNQTVARLQELVNQVKASTVQVNTFLGQNEAAAVQLSQTSQTQRQEAGRTLDSVKAMIDGTSLMAQNAQQVAASSQTVAAQVATSESSIDLTAARINQLNDTSINAIKQIEGLGRSSQNIGQVTEMIRELASDISALANQARTETPPSGISSADSARHLEDLTQKINLKANRTLQETTLIDSFLNTLAQRSQQVASAIEQINDQVSISTQQVQTSKQSFEEVARVAQQFDQLAQSIATATQDQTQTSQAIATLVQEVVSLSDQTANFSQNIERALHETLTTAQNLQNSISRFKVDK